MGACGGSTRLAHVAKLWLAELDRRVRLGERAHRTLNEYTDTVRNHIVPRLGELTCHEVEDDIAACDDTIQGVQDRVGTSAAIRTKTVLSQICGYAVRHKAMGTNPVKSVSPIETRGKREIKVLAREQRRDFLVKLDGWVREKVDTKVNGRRYSLGKRADAWLDLPEIAIGMLATGGCLGELLAVAADDVDPAARTVHLAHHVVRITGEGIVRVDGRKGDEPPITVRVPSWSVPMWRARKLASGGGPLFPTWNGQWEDPSNVAKRLRQACDGIGYPWVASHVFRRTVGTHLGDSDVTNEAISDQLGNTPEMVQEHYRAKRVANEAVAEALESQVNTNKETNENAAHRQPVS